MDESNSWAEKADINICSPSRVCVGRRMRRRWCSRNDIWTKTSRKKMSSLLKLLDGYSFLSSQVLEEQQWIPCLISSPGLIHYVNLMHKKQLCFIITILFCWNSTSLGVVSHWVEQYLLATKHLNMLCSNGIRRKILLSEWLQKSWRSFVLRYELKKEIENNRVRSNSASQLLRNFSLRKGDEWLRVTL